MTIIGIDTGEHTGVAVWDTQLRQFTEVTTIKLHQALDMVKTIASTIGKENTIVIFEDARQRKYIPMEKTRSEYRGRLMGAGSIKRDAVIWEEFLSDNHIPFAAVPPRKGLTKWNEDHFKMMTGWASRTSGHARDAALLVFGLNDRNAKMYI